MGQQVLGSLTPDPNPRAPQWNPGHHGRAVFEETGHLVMCCLLLPVRGPGSTHTNNRPQYTCGHLHPGADTHRNTEKLKGIATRPVCLHPHTPRSKGQGISVHTSLTHRWTPSRALPHQADLSPSWGQAGAWWVALSHAYRSTPVFTHSQTTYAPGDPLGDNTEQARVPGNQGWPLQPWVTLPLSFLHLKLRNH